MTVSVFHTPFNYTPRLSTLFDQAINISSTDNFAPHLHLRLLSYHCCRPRCLPYQAVNISSIDKSTVHRSRSMSSSTSSQICISVDTSRIHNPRLCYSSNSCQRLDMTDSLKTMN